MTHTLWSGDKDFHNGFLAARRVRACMDLREPAHNLARVSEAKVGGRPLYFFDNLGNGTWAVRDGMIRDAKSGAGSVTVGNLGGCGDGASEEHNQYGGTHCGRGAFDVHGFLLE
ncbi:UNVERIFIED_ORG: hypothetical protein ABIB21_003298 [Arthrobacter sp. UYEF13]